MDALVEDIQTRRQEVAEEAAIVESRMKIMRITEAARLKAVADLAEAQIAEHCKKAAAKEKERQEDERQEDERLKDSLLDLFLL